ncbi:unnamed protein product, partial [Oppiella nova]
MSDKECVVCGDGALGYNFGALTCESCRTFFRRNVTRVQEFECFFNKKCDINYLTRKFCKKCRIEKCFAMGMKRGMFHFGRDRRNISNPIKHSTDKECPQVSTVSSATDLIDMNGIEDDYSIVNDIPSLIRGLIFNFNELEMHRLKHLFSSTAYMRDPIVTNVTKTATYSDAFKVLRMRSDMKCQKIIKMCKNINQFKELCEDDKIILLKTSSPEIACLYKVVNFNVQGQFWTVPIDSDNGLIIPLDILKLQQMTYMYLLQRYLELKYNSKSPNFGALACESCRIFFRRNATRAQKYTCSFNNQCAINQLTRKFCTKCRIAKCFTIGMKIESKRSYKRKSMKYMLMYANANNINNTNQPMILNTVDNSCESIANPMASLIRGLIFNFNELEMTRFKRLFTSTAYMKEPKVMRRTTSQVTKCSDGVNVLQTRTETKCRNIIKMSTNMSEFNDLCEDDKITLLKKGCHEIICLLTVVNFDFKCDSWRVPI